LSDLCGPFLEFKHHFLPLFFGLGCFKLQSFSIRCQGPDLIPSLFKISSELHLIVSFFKLKKITLLAEI